MKIVINDFTRPELEAIKSAANFSADETMLFELRSRKMTFEECADEMCMSVSTVKRLNKKIISKIIRVL